MKYGPADGLSWRATSFAHLLSTSFLLLPTSSYPFHARTIPVRQLRLPAQTHPLLTRVYPKFLHSFDIATSAYYMKRRTPTLLPASDAHSRPYCPRSLEEESSPS